MSILTIWKRLTWLLVLVMSITYFPSAHAHLKWFVNDTQPPHLIDNIVSYSLVWVGIGGIIILIGVLMDRAYPKISATWEPILFEKYATSIFGICLGVSLTINALNGNLFSMNIHHTGVPDFTLMLEGFIGLCLIIGLAVRQASILLLGLWVIATQTVGMIKILENLWIVGAASFFLSRGRPVLRYSNEDVFSLLGNRISYAQALSLLRIFLGINLIFLGFSEKILAPELGLAFLQKYQWNFMLPLGLNWFSNELFVFSAGAVEIILGIFLVAGWVVRLTAMTLVVLFLTPPFFMGIHEMIGHIPHISIVIMLLLFGRGNKITITNVSSQ